MRDSTVVKAVLTSILILGMGIPAGHAQNIFFGMMSEQTPTVYNNQSRQEISEQQARDMFRAMDVNSDGVVTAEEFNAAYPGFYPDDDGGRLAAARFRALDIKSDGKVTREEFIANRNVPADEHYTMAVTPNGARDAGDGDGDGE